MNKVILIGRMTADPEVKTTNGGVSVCTFRIAVDRKFKNKDGVREADFISCVAWRNTAEFIGKYVTKGRKVSVEGSLQTRSYDAQDGSKRHVTEVAVESIETLDRAQEGAQGASGGKPSNSGFTEVEDDELPF